MDNKNHNLVVVKNENSATKNKKVKKVKKPKNNTKKANKQKKKSSGFINIKNIVLIIIAIALIAGIVYMITHKGNVHIGEDDSRFSTEFGVNSNADFCIIGKKNVFYCTKDTATLLDKKGEPIWSDTFSMVSPAILYDGNFVGLADIKNKVFNLYGLEGKVYSLETDGNITAFAVNPLGACAIVCKNGTDNDYTVSVYNSKGEKMFMGSYVSSDGIPMTVDISNDSSKVAVGFINTKGLKVTSNVLFYSTDKAVAATIENSDAMFSAVNCEKEVVGSIHFLDDDSCIIATDTSLMNIGGDNVAQYQQNWRMEFNNYVTALDIVDSKYVAVAYGESIEGSLDSVEKNSIFWYNTKSGNVKGSTLMDSSVSKLSSGLGCSIAELDNNVYYALKPSGREIWSYEGIQNISNILFYGDTDTVAVISATKMTITDIKNGANNTELDNDESSAKKPARQETDKFTKKSKNTESNTEQTTVKAAEETTAKAKEKTTAKQN